MYSASPLPVRETLTSLYDQSMFGSTLRMIKLAMVCALGALGIVSQMNAQSLSTASAGGHTMFVKTDATLWGTGANQYGQLGNGTKVNQSSAVHVANGVSSVAAGDAH